MAQPTAQADGRQGQRIDNYTKFWNQDMSQEVSADTEKRNESYTDVVNGPSPITTTCPGILS